MILTEMFANIFISFLIDAVGMVLGGANIK